MLRFALPGSLIAIASLAAGCARPADPPFTATVRGTEAACSVQVGGQDVTSDQLLEIARRQVARTRRAQLLGGTDVPYRCIGGAIYTLQLAGFSAVDFNTGPSSGAP